ncbi:MAG: 4-hydroxy-3-methylbut-2-enyl diphosphate reductase, partial [Clostridia bacterium]|nr:4-hydroxy-3-methylbut-2-enyl diphosphate reductase [Clostridia bacterium]
MSDRIVLAKTAGFCFGVNRAVSMIYSKVSDGCRVCTLGPIIHNPQVISDLESKGVICVQDVTGVPQGYELIIRTHGITAQLEDEVKKSGIPYINATCPFVTKIHNIIKKYSTPDSIFFIAGDETHPEVCGFRSHCNGESYVFKNVEELEKMWELFDKSTQKKIFCLAQTTFSIKEWKKSSFFVGKLCTNAIIFDTICFATDKRQKEAEELAQKSDLMVVVGGRFSSNTVKLYEVCKRYCDTLLVETADELKQTELSHYRSIGVTAGASTPAGIIKEVLFTMSENLNEQTTTNPVSEEISFADALEENLSHMSSEKRVVGVVVGVSATEIQVDIGRKHAGFVKREDYSDDPNADPAKELKIGDEINLIIMKTNDAEGTVMLSKRLYDASAAWEKLAAAQEEGAVLEGIVAEVVKGGLRVFTNGVRVFVPASHATLRRTDDLQSLLKTTVKLEIIEVNPAARRAVGSIRNVLKKEQKEITDALWAGLEVGKSYTGTVKSLTSYGAFVDIGGVDGMVHISELSWSRIKHPSEVVKEGDEITVTVGEEVDYNG